MRSFRDTENRQWQLIIDVAAVKRCRGLLSLDLYGLVDEKAKGLGELLSDPCKLVDVLYVLCKQQCEKLNVSDEDFGRGFAGDTLTVASDAFVEELIDFFPDPQTRSSLRKMVKKATQLRDLIAARGHKETETALEKLDLDSLADKLMSSSSNVPASSVLTPTPGPSPTS